MTALNAVVQSYTHGLTAAGAVEGTVQCFDPRVQAVVGVLDVAKSCSVVDSVPEVTALTFLTDGLTLAAGTSNGQVLLYDIRATKPLLVKDHNYELPIRRIVHHPVSCRGFTK